jgi:hypothetical protein
VSDLENDVIEEKNKNYEIVNHDMILKIRLSGESKRWDVMVDKVEQYLIKEVDYKNMNKKGKCYINQGGNGNDLASNKQDKKEDIESLTKD